MLYSSGMPCSRHSSPGAQPAAAPVKRSHIRSRLGLDRRRRARRVQLEQEGPVARAPLEQRLGVTRALGVVQVVAPRGDRGEQVPVFAVDPLLGLRPRAQTGKRLACCQMGQEFLDVRRRQSPLVCPPMGRRRQLQGGALAGADQEETLAVLRHAVVGGVQDRVGGGVSDLLDPLDQRAEERRRAVAVGEAIDVLHEIGRRAQRGQETQEVAQQPGPRVPSFALVLQVESRLRERHARRTADQQINLAAGDLQFPHHSRRLQFRDVERLHLRQRRVPALAVAVERAHRDRVILDRIEDLAAGGLAAAVEAPRAREERDGPRLGGGHQTGRSMAGSPRVPLIVPAGATRSMFVAIPRNLKQRTGCHAREATAAPRRGPRHSIRRLCRPPLTQRPERLPELTLGFALVE